MLPPLRDRPLTLERFPDGIDGEGFYQKHAADYFPDWLARVTVEANDGDVTHVMAQNQASLAFLVAQNTISLHPWLSRRDRLRQPDQIVFDLDPAGDDFAPVRAAALELRKWLEAIGGRPLVKTTGSRGVHVVVPLRRGPDFDEVREFARAVADRLAADHPHDLTTEVRKEKRAGRVFVDILRNAYAQTAVAPYSVRARPGAPVAAPITWDELRDAALGPRTFAVTNVPSRIQDGSDPWTGGWRHAVALRTLQRGFRALTEQRD